MQSVVVEERVQSILLDLLDVDADQVVPSAHLKNDLNATSIDMVELITALENQFDIDISDDDVASLGTVQSVSDFVRNKTA